MNVKQTQRHSDLESFRSNAIRKRLRNNNIQVMDNIIEGISFPLKHVLAKLLDYLFFYTYSI